MAYGQTTDRSVPVGPDAPDLIPISLDREIAFMLYNDPSTSNNADLDYAERVPGISSGEADSLYLFEGYMVFQLQGPDVPLTMEALLNPNLARLVFQADLKNDITRLYNWFPEPIPGTDDTLFYPELMVEGKNQGLRHSFSVKFDAFSPRGANRLFNGVPYYFTAIAYAQNNYRQFDPFVPSGQATTFLAGIEYRQVYEAFAFAASGGQQFNSNYGGGVKITRLEGAGNSSQFLRLKSGVLDAIISGNFDGELPYMEGYGPLDVQIVDPQNILDRVIEIEFFDSKPDTSILLSDARFRAFDPSTGEEIISPTGLKEFNEVLLKDFGISIFFGQPAKPGQDPLFFRDNGFVGSEITYSDPNGPEWLSFLKNEPFESPVDPNAFNFIKTLDFQPHYDRDPFQVFTEVNQSGFYPLCLAYNLTHEGPLISPALVGVQTLSCAGVRSDGFNVDIVFTPDKSKWSRTVVVEAANSFHRDEELTWRESLKFDILDRPAASHTAGPDGLPEDDPDLPNGFSWFPGYAIDVETGKRLNIIFAENSLYSPENSNPDIANLPAQYLKGDDRIWNPGSEKTINAPGFSRYFAGGQHFIYISGTEYDGCEQIHTLLSSVTPRPVRLLQVLRNISWTAIPLATSLLSYDEGLIPNEVTVSLRTSQPFRITDLDPEGNKIYNRYRLEIIGKEKGPLSNIREASLSQMNVQLLNNPGRDKLSFQVHSDIDFSYSIEVYNVEGVLMYSGRSGNVDYQIETNTWASGLYLLRLQSDGFAPSTFRWIKQ